MFTSSFTGVSSRRDIFFRLNQNRKANGTNSPETSIFTDKFNPFKQKIKAL